MPLTKHAAWSKDMAAPMARMEHRHLATIAAIIRRGPVHQHAWAEHFARELEAANPKFDRARFLRVCFEG